MISPDTHPNEHATLRDLITRIRNFDVECNAEDYTDTGDAWELLETIEDELTQMTRTDRDTDHDHEKHRATCGNCGLSWCYKCDPCPSALCHWCHGRGYSLMPLRQEA